MELDLQKLGEITPEQFGEFISELMERDQPALLQLLYRLDVDEEKIRLALAGNPPHLAGDAIALLILDRLEQRKKNRDLFPRTPEGDIPEEERW